MAARKKKPSASIEDEFLTSTTKRMNVELVEEKFNEFLGGEEALAKWMADSLKGDKLKGGAQTGIAKMVLEMMTRRRDEGDLNDIPPAELLEAYYNHWCDDQVKKTRAKLLQELRSDDKAIEVPSGQEAVHDGEVGVVRQPVEENTRTDLDESFAYAI